MFRPQIQKTSTLFFIALFNVFMVFLAVKSETKIKRLGFDVSLLKKLIHENPKNILAF